MNHQARAWFAHIHFNGAEKAFYFGTVFAATELEAERALKLAIAEILPTVPALKLCILIPGQIIAVPERAERVAA